MGHSNRATSANFCEELDQCFVALIPRTIRSMLSHCGSDVRGGGGGGAGEKLNLGRGRVPLGADLESEGRRRGGGGCCKKGLQLPQA